MANTDLLLGLVEEFPAAFSDPESPKPAPGADSKTNQLLALANEFPEAFADPEAEAAVAAAVAVATEKSEKAALKTPAPLPEPVAAPLAAELPPGYRTALQRRVTTYTWGTIDCYFTYGENGLGETGLQQFWVTVGKSGTEVQSLCEAITRLVNLLLAQQVPVAAITKQLRGIRGGTPEGLGPNTLLGLADLIGKVLQEAPSTGLSNGLASGIVASPSPAGLEVEMLGERDIPETTANLAVAAPQNSPAASIASTSTVSTATAGWTSLSDDLLEAALCPECGAQLQQMNGCSGGACAVCGYSSCS
jgi:hypothetical protein